jgi:hypothetical protein
VGAVPILTIGAAAGRSLSTAEQLESDGMDDALFAALFRGAIKQCGRNRLRDEQRCAERQHDLTEQAAGHQSHQDSPRSSRVTSAPKR